ncbi:MAG: transcriptional regulator [Rhodospirillaceae bacterium]|nr:MAG: transcriptional regulator [Rhodospirillaceae bacterium]
MDNAYRYTASGLDNVVLVDLKKCTDDHGEECVIIPSINKLHNAIAADILKRRSGMMGAELKFLRTLMGITQAELGKIVNREAQTIGRWERGEFEDDPNAEAIIRLVTAERLNLELDAPIEKITEWCVQTAKNPLIQIDASDPSNYRPIAA